MTAARLRLYQLVSPALPVGAFSYSEGLEVLVQAGRISTAVALRAWIEAELERGGLRIEAAALPGLQADLATWRDGPVAAERRAAAARVQGRDGWLLAQREAPELRAQQRQMGLSLLQLLADLGWSLPPDPAGGGSPPLAWPAAFAWAGVVLAVAPLELVEAYLYGWVANQLSAAVRLVPLGPTAAQALQLEMAPRIAAQAEALVAADPERLWSGGVGASLAQLQHGALYSRLFRS